MLVPMIRRFFGCESAWGISGPQAQEQAAFYVIPESERLKHAKNRGAMIESIKRRNGEEAAGYSNEGRQGHVYSYCLA